MSTIDIDEAETALKFLQVVYSRLSRERMALPVIRGWGVRSGDEVERLMKCVAESAKLVIEEGNIWLHPNDPSETEEPHLAVKVGKWHTCQHIPEEKQDDRQ